jgi:tetratricopeptide (TPR) repeat protein
VKIGFGKDFGLAGLAVPVLLMASYTGVVAQVPSGSPAKVHGQVKDPGGFPLTAGGEIRLSNDKTAAAKDRKYQYTFPIGTDSTYKGEGIAPGDYIAFVFSKDKSVDYLPIVIKSGEDRTLDFDMSREEYLKSLSSEDRAAIEAGKKKNATILVENSKIANINKTLTDARSLAKAGKPDDAVAQLKPLTEMKPNEPVVWAALGEAQLASADLARKTAITNKTPLTDPALLAKYSDSAASYQKAIDLEKALAKPHPEVLFSSYLNLGQANARAGKIDDAAAAYENAAKANPAVPTSAGSAYYNEAATFFNAQKMDEAAAAADKAIQADPKRAEAQYIKAAALVPRATVDPKTSKYILPPGCLEAYQAYLELAPDGPHAAEVKQLLDGLGQSQKSSYKAGKK